MERCQVTAGKNTLTNSGVMGAGKKSVEAELLRVKFR